MSNNVVIENSRRQTITQISSVISIRANLDGDARRFNLKKLAITAINQVLLDAKAACNEINLFSESSFLVPEELGLNLREGVVVRCHPSEFSSLFDIITADSEASYVGVVGTSLVGKNPVAAALAQSLSRFHVVSQRKFLLELTDTYRGGRLKFNPRQRLDHRDILVQEKPGKLAVLDLLPQTLKSNIKAWRDAIVGPTMDTKRSLCAADGWGIFGSCLKIGASSEGEGDEAVEIVIAEVNIESYQFHIEVPAMIVEIAVDWFRKFSPAGLSESKSIEILCPYIAVATAFTEAFGEKIGKAEATRLISHEHLLLGWNPLNSLLSTLTNCSGPSLIIEMTNFPRVILVAILK